MPAPLLIMHPFSSSGWAKASYVILTFYIALSQECC